MSWKGKLLRHPDGREGHCVDDDNSGIFRILTVELDNEPCAVWLSNVGPTPERYQKWAWLYHPTKLPRSEAVLQEHCEGDEWVEFGP